MRIELSDENTLKAQEAEKQLRDKYGLQVSPNQIVNIFFSAIENAELHQLVKLTIALPQGKETDPPRKKSLKSSTNWVITYR